MESNEGEEKCKKTENSCKLETNRVNDGGERRTHLRRASSQKATWADIRVVAGVGY